MKFSKSLLAVIAMAGTMGFSAVASAMDFTVYGSLRAGLYQADTDDAKVTAYGDSAEALAAVIAAEGGATAAQVALLGAGVDTSAANANTALNRATNLALAQEAWATLVKAQAPDAAEATRNGLGRAEFDISDLTVGEVTTKAADAQLVLGHDVGAASRVGVMGSEDLGNGAEAGFHWETAIGDKGDLVSYDEINDTYDGTGRLANVWYSGAFGKITIGQQGNPYRNAANWDQSYYLGGQNRYGGGGPRLQGVRYDGSAGAFNFSVMAEASSADTSAAALTDVYYADGVAAGSAHDCDASNVATAAVTTNGVTCRASESVIYEEVESETGVDSWIATGHYDMGVATINLGYRIDNTEVQRVGTGYDNFVISANGALDALDWFIAFETNTDNANAKGSSQRIGGDAAALGTTGNAEANAAAELGAKAADSLTTLQDTTTIGLFLNYNISDVSQVYLEWEDTANDGLDLAGENLDKTSTLLGFGRKIGPNTAFIAEYLSVDNGSEAVADNTAILGTLKVDF